MKHIKSDALLILAEVCMEVNNGDVNRSFNEIKKIDDLLGILAYKSILNRSRGRRSNAEKRFQDIFVARLVS